MKLKKAPTVYDVAEQAGVSVATVSRVLYKPEAVRISTRDRVMSVVRELGYLPSGSARTLASRHNGILGLFLPGFDGIEEPGPAAPANSGITIIDDTGSGNGSLRPTTYFHEVLYGAELEAWHKGFALMIAAGRRPSQEMMLNNVAGHVDGLAVVSRTVEDELLHHVARRIPLVTVAGAPEFDTIDHVSVDNEGGMHALVSHLITERGVSSLTYFAGPEDSPDNLQRLHGFSRAAKDSAAEVRTEVTGFGDFTQERGFELGLQLIDNRNLTDVLVCGNDQLALGVLDACALRGVAVPGDVLITGFDGIEAGRYSSPPITTVQQPMAALGREAMRILAARLEAPDRPTVFTQMPVSILLRQSTA